MFVIDPSALNEVNDLVAAATTLRSAPFPGSIGPSSTSTPVWADDVFARLPPEILCQLLLCLPIESMYNLRAASRAIASLELDSTFWKRQTRKDMPWRQADDPPSNTHSRHTYQYLRRLSTVNTSKNNLALANRKRIFEISEQLANEYWRRYSEKQLEHERTENR